MLETNQEQTKGQSHTLFISAKEVQDSIFNLGRELMDEHPFFQRIKNENLPKKTLGIYFYNVKELVTETVPNLKRAVEVSKNQKLGEELTSTLEKKILEEDGHEQWAQDDLNRLQLSKEEIKEMKLTKTMSHFLPYIIDVAKTDPLSYFIYAYYIEELMVVAGPHVLSAMMKSSGVGEDYFTIISTHIEFDQDHAGEGAEVLDRLLQNISEGQNKNVKEVVSKTRDFIWGLYGDLEGLF